VAAITAVCHGGKATVTAIASPAGRCTSHRPRDGDLFCLSLLLLSTAAMIGMNRPCSSCIDLATIFSSQQYPELTCSFVSCKQSTCRLRLQGSGRYPAPAAHIFCNTVLTADSMNEESIDSTPTQQPQEQPAGY
jgi:hypothetical protein